MFTITSSTDDLLSHKVDCYAYIVEKNFDVDQLSGTVKNVSPDFLTLVKHRKFVGNAEQVISMPFSHDGRIAFFIVAGMGDNESKGVGVVERYRRALGQLVKEARSCKATSVAIALTAAEECNVTYQYLAEQTAIVLKKAQYHFDDYITEKSRKEGEIAEFVLVTDKAYQDEVQQGIADGIIIGDAINQARHWVDTPPSNLTPQHLVEKAQEVAQRNNLKISI